MAGVQKVFHAWNVALLGIRYPRRGIVARTDTSKHGIYSEPGIYIPEEGLGIRIEDDLVVQATGEPFNLMRNIPIEIDEIETLMHERK